MITQQENREVIISPWSQKPIDTKCRYFYRGLLNAQVFPYHTIWTSYPYRASCSNLTATLLHWNKCEIVDPHTTRLCWKEKSLVHNKYIIRLKLQRQRDQATFVSPKVQISRFKTQWNYTLGIRTNFSVTRIRRGSDKKQQSLDNLFLVHQISMECSTKISKCFQDCDYATVPWSQDSSKFLLLQQAIGAIPYNCLGRQI